MFFLNEACIHQVDKTLLRSRVVVLRQVLTRCASSRLTQHSGHRRGPAEEIIDKVVDVLHEFDSSVVRLPSTRQSTEAF